MRLFAILCLATLFGSCVTPDHWKAEDHEEMMSRCRVMCGDAGVESYDTWLARCMCHVSKGGVK